MSEKTDDLRDIFLEVSDDPTLTERQEEGASKAPVEEEAAEVAAAAAKTAREDGLSDAVEGVEAGDAAAG